MKLTNPSLRPYLTTVRFIANGGPKGAQVGTGFFLDFSCGEGRTSRWLITNKHIIEGSTEMALRLHAGVQGADGTVMISQESFDLAVGNPSAITINHPTEDLCAISGAELTKGAESKGKALYAESLTEDMIPTQAELEGMATLEDVVVIGYPANFIDSVNNLPILRRGVTASHPGVRFNGECRGMIDIACYGGSSGSPVLIWKDGFCLKGGEVSEHSTRSFLGVVSSHQAYDEGVAVTVNNAPTAPVVAAKVPMPLHLGIYIRAEAVLILKNEIIAKGKSV